VAIATRLNHHVVLYGNQGNCPNRELHGELA
jgi:hypothetical protein